MMEGPCPSLTWTLMSAHSVVLSFIKRTVPYFLKVSPRQLLKTAGNTICTPVYCWRTPKGRHFRSDFRPPFSLWRKIAVRTTTDRRRLNHAQPGTVVVRKSLKSTGQQPRRHASFTKLPFAVHLYRPGFGAETFFFTHPLEFVRHLQARRHASGSAGTKEIRPKESGLQTAPSVLQTASASPEAVCFELRHLCRRESVKT